MDSNWERVSSLVEEYLGIVFNVGIASLFRC